MCIIDLPNQGRIYYAGMKVHEGLLYQGRIYYAGMKVHEGLLYRIAMRSKCVFYVCDIEVRVSVKSERIHRVLHAAGRLPLIAYLRSMD